MSDQTDLTPTADSLLSGENAVQVFDEHGRPLARIEVRPESGNGRPLPPALARHLGPIIERLPSLVSDGARLLGEQDFHVVLNPELTGGVGSGALRMMGSVEAPEGFRLNVVVNEPGRDWGDKPGQIVGQGTNVPASRVAQLASAGFQVATYVTGQVHLAEISKRLDTIEQTTREILNLVHDVQAGAIAGKMGRVHEIARRLQAGDIGPDDIVRLDLQLDEIDLSAREVAEALRREVDRHEQEILSTSPKRAWFDGGESERNRVRALKDRYMVALERYQFALGVRLAAAELKSMLVGESLTTELRRGDVVSACEQGKESARRTVAHAQELINKAASVFGDRPDGTVIVGALLKHIAPPSRHNGLGATRGDGPGRHSGPGGPGTDHREGRVRPRPFAGGRSARGVRAGRARPGAVAARSCSPDTAPGHPIR